MKIFNKYWLLVVFTAYIFMSLGCAKFDSNESQYDKPQSLIDQEVLNSYKPLKSYVNYNGQINFKLGVELTFNDLVNNSLLYRMLQEHFDQITFTDKLNHLNYVQGSDSITLNDFREALEANDTTGLSVYAGSIIWHKNQNAAYLNSLLADSILQGTSGSDVVVDFESSTIGDDFPTTTGDASATIVADPDGKSGNAVRILKVTGTAFPQFKVNLPDGKTLGQYESVSVDFKGGGCCGFYGAGMRMAITEGYGNPSLTGYGGPSSFGIAGDQWGRGLIVLPLENLNLSTDQKKLTSFVLTIGSQTGAPDYLLDNVRMNWKISGDTIRKSDEQKANIIRGELGRWVKAVVLTGKGHVGSWSVVKEPMDDDNPAQIRTGKTIEVLPANTFYWQDYLGKDYAAIAIDTLRKYSDATNKVFITETNLLNNRAKVQGLSDFIKYTEQKGAKVDGIATELALNINSDTVQVETLLSELAGTGKLIKISSLDIGTGGSANQATTETYQRQADKYQWFVEAYNKLIPAAQRAGISFRSPVDQSSSSNWRPGEPVGLWNMQNNRKQAYKGVVEGLQNK